MPIEEKRVDARPIQEKRRMTRRQALVVGGGAAGAAMLAACGANTSTSSTASGKPSRGGIATLSYGDASNQDRLDPARLIDAFEVFAGGLLFDNLVGVNQANQPVPALAKSWSSSKDAKRWTFELVDGVEFHDGRGFTSKDAAFTIRRVLDPKLGSGAYALFAPFLKPANIRTPEPHVLQLDCLAPCAFMPVLLSTYFMRVLPDGTTPEETEKGIGTGPFRLRSFKPGVELQVDRNPHYWISGRPFLDGVKTSIVFEPSTKLQSVIAGDADACDAIPYSQIPSVEGNSAVNMLVAKGAGFTTYVLYQKEDPFKDVRVRQAFKYAMNRQEIVEQVFFNHATVSADISIPPQDPFYPRDVEPFPHDPEKAKSLLKEAGFGDGLSIEMLTADVAPGMVEGALTLQQQAKESGIAIDVRKLPTGTYFTQVIGKPLFGDFWLRQNVGYSLPLLYGGGSNAVWDESGFADAQVNDAIRRMQSTLDVSAQKQAVADAYQIINETCGELIPGHNDRVWLTKPRLHGVELDYSKVASFTNAYLD